MPVVHVPVPCAVYVREDARRERYAFSHFCELVAPKAFPASLRVGELRAHDARQNWAALQRACFLVLVSGDVAQCVSVASAGEKARTRLLYLGSAYARPVRSAIPTELHEGYVSLHFQATMAVYGARGHALHAVIPLECGVCLLPKVLREADLPKYAEWVQSCLQRSLQASVWVSPDGDSYNEQTRQCRRPRKASEKNTNGV